MCSSARVELHCTTMVVELWVAPAPLLVLEIQPEDYGCGGDRRDVPCEEQQCFLLCDIKMFRVLGFQVRRNKLVSAMLVAK